jgi:hypothetical protein
MDEDLKQYLDGKFAAVDTNFAAVDTNFAAVDTNFAAVDTKFAAIDAKLAAIDAKLAAIDGKFASIDGKFVEFEGRIMERVGGRIDAVEERLRDYVRQSGLDLETKIITEFHKWGRTSDMRTRQAITDTGLLGERMLAVEDRISALERERRG